MIKNRMVGIFRNCGWLQQVNWLLVLALFQNTHAEAQTGQEITGAVSKNNYEGYNIIRVFTYNIFHGARPDGKIDMDLFADIIKEHNPDLV